MTPPSSPPWETLRPLLSPKAVLQSDPTYCLAYSYDNSRLHYRPEAVVLPSCEADVIATVRWCYQRQIPLTCRGHGTGTTGGAVAIHGGIVLSFEKMQRLDAIDSANRMVTVEPGVTNQALQQAAAADGFFWPPDPTSAAVCTIGGNLACNAAGPRAVKYGTPRDNSLALRAVTGTGELITTGSKTTKGVVGYDLTRLLIGSEGTLAVITEATLKLHPLPQARQLMQISFASPEAAAEAVAAIMAQPLIPYSLEFIDQQAIEMIRDYSRADLPSQAAAILLVEVEGSPATLSDAVLTIEQAVRASQPLEVKKAATAVEAEAIWRTRKALSPALRKVAPKKINEDIVVPVSQIPTLLRQLTTMQQRHGIKIVTFGHAGNGNLHVNLLIDPDDPAQRQAAKIALNELFDLTLKLGGTLSGEHGIGLVKRDFVSREIPPATLALMHAIKAQFDPAGILNPGKSI
ncbi:FAD-binding protein [Ectothiorhodospiraceae bacterium BW-2]|nr:FAD-binding protein [Ectothiorhodospiraceae bacterium BW-2]